MVDCITVKQAAELYGETERSIRNRIRVGDLIAHEQYGASGGGTSGKSYRVEVTSLSLPAQRKYYEQLSNGTIPSFETTGAREERKRLSMTDLQAIYGPERLDAYLPEANRKIKLFSEADALPRGNVVDGLQALCDQYGYDLRNYYRWRKAYKRDGIAGLLPKPRADKGTPKKLCDEAAWFIRGCYLQSSRPPKMHVYQAYVLQAEKCGWEVASRATICRELDRIPRDETVLGREGERAYNAKCRPKVTRDWDSLIINQVWCGDGHTLAILTPDGKRIRRYTFSAWMDMRSRAITGWCIAPHSNSEVIMLALRHGILPKEDSPIKGLPGAAYMDNGRDYKSKRLNGVKDFTEGQKGFFSELGIEVSHAIPYSPWSKPIERFFRTLSEQFSKYMPGSCGESIDRKPFDLDKNDILLKNITIDMVAEALEDYINYYNNTVHSSLRGKTPLEVYDEVPMYRADMPRAEELEFLLLEEKAARISASGIKKNGAFYWHDDFIHHDGDIVSIRFDPMRMDEIYVRLGEKLVIAATKELISADGSEGKELGRSMEIANRASKETRNNLKRYGVSDEQFRETQLSQFITKPELLAALTGKNADKDNGSSSVIRINKNTRDGLKIKQRAEAERMDLSYFDQRARQFHEANN